MGGELLTSPKGGEESPPSKYSEVFYEHEPFYLFVGMTEGQYWNGDATLTKKYRKVYEYKKAERNQELWMQGLYIYEALLDVSPMFRDFVKKPHPLPYPDRPYATTKEEEEERAKSKEQAEMESLMEQVRAWKKRISEKREK